MSFKPEVGKMYETNNYGIVELMLPEKDSEGFWLVKANNGTYLKAGNLRPIQTEADKQRDEQIDLISEVAFRAESNDLTDVAAALYDAGGRVIAPDEYVVKALTDEQKEQITKGWNDHTFTLIDLVDAVQRELGIGE